MGVSNAVKPGKLMRTVGKQKIITVTVASGLFFFYLTKTEIVLCLAVEKLGGYYTIKDLIKLFDKRFSSKKI